MSQLSHECYIPYHVDGLVQDCSISMADALEMLQSCTNCYVVFKQELIAPNSYDFCLDQQDYVDGLVQDCSNSSALAVELLQSCTKPSIWYLAYTF